MSDYTLQDSIYYISPFINGAPLAAWSGNEMITSAANMIQSTITNSPLTWPWNRNENTSYSTVVGQQDYILPITDFKALEKLSLTDTTGKIFEVQDVINTGALAKSSTLQRPASVSVQYINYGTNVKLRFMGVPDQIYAMTIVYQKTITEFTVLNQPWYIPAGYKNIYNSLLLAEAFEFVNDARAGQYRQRGIALLLGRAEGLTEMQKNIFMQQFLATESQQQSNQLRTQQYNQARGA